MGQPGHACSDRSRRRTASPLERPPSRTRGSGDDLRTDGSARTNPNRLRRHHRRAASGVGRLDRRHRGPGDGETQRPPGQRDERVRAPAFDRRHESSCQERQGRSQRQISLDRHRHGAQFGRSAEREPVRQRDRIPIRQRKRLSLRQRDRDAEREHDAERVAERAQPYRVHQCHAEPEPFAEQHADADPVAHADPDPDTGDTAALRAGPAILWQQRPSGPNGHL
jgi:hypothetical protein